MAEEAKATTFALPAAANGGIYFWKVVTCLGNGANGVFLAQLGPFLLFCFRLLSFLAVKKP